MIRVGTDLVDIARIEQSYRRFGQRFLNRIFTEEEIRYCFSMKHPMRHLAARFAAKEAVVKCFGFMKNYGYRDIGIVHDGRGKPELTMSPILENIFREMNFRDRDVSITHTDAQAQAVVVFQTPGNREQPAV